MGNFFNKGSMTMKLHILKVLYDLESHAKDGRCGLSRNEDIRRCVCKLVEKQSIVLHTSGAFLLPMAHDLIFCSSFFALTSYPVYTVRSSMSNGSEHY